MLIDILNARGLNPTSLEAWLVFKEKVLSVYSVRKLPKSMAVELAFNSGRILDHLFIGEGADKWRRYIEYFWDVTLSPSLPFRVEDDEEHGGLKLVGNCDTVVEDIDIMGFFFPVSDAEYTLLVQARYFSLFKTSREKLGVLFGPLSLVNHSCSSRWFFPDPCRRKKKDKDILEDYLCVWNYLKCDDLDVDIKYENEWLVNYFPMGKTTRPAWFVCNCIKCSYP